MRNPNNSSGREDGSKKHRPFLGAIPIAMGTISAMLAIDLYLPAIPGLPAALGGTAAQAQYSLGAFMAAFAVGQLVFGVLGDRYDRRRVLAFALAGLALSSLLCASASTMLELIVLRGLQGFTAAAGAALAPALLREMADGVAVIRLMGFVSSLQALVPAVAPALGTWMLHHASWRWSFVAVTAMASVAASALVLFAPARAGMSPPRGGNMLTGYAVLLTTRTFMGYVISHGLAFGALLTFIMAAPYVVTRHAHGTLENFAVMQVVLVSCFVIGANFAAPVVKRIGSDATIVAGSALQAIGGVALLAVTVAVQHVTVIMLAGAMMLVNLGHGLRGGVGLAKVMDVRPEYSGSASAMMVFLSASIGSIGTPALAPFLPGSVAALGIAVAIQASASLLVLPLALSFRRRIAA